jgi:AraC family transcriptional regulator of adaptative response/methylated-DNA-[protein]-cysteine methyltransferase
MLQLLPDSNTLYNAILTKDESFEGIFIVGVKTTGVCCRPTCTARKPKQENVEFFNSVREALLHGYRPCKICNPLGNKGEVPAWLEPLLNEVNSNPGIRLTDYDLRTRGIEPHRVRRWFKQQHGMTFQTYLRTLRIGNAFGRIQFGDKVIEAAFESGYESLSGFNESFRKTLGVTPGKSQRYNLITVTRILTPLGPLLAGGTEEGICLLEFVDRRMLETQIKRLQKLLKAEFVPGNNKYFTELNSQIQEYFTGKRKNFTIPLILKGTSFQEKVWKELQTIPYGVTRSYQEQAENVGNIQAVRAVAKANGDNRIAIIIPCYRVIGKNGKLRGYGGGLWRKQYLLDHEFRYK